jgi:glycosyltransferase involved in cell wall biosynthesis
MRIVIDLQACQSQSAQRGIGRYSFSLVDAIVKINTKHEIFIALSAAFPNTISALKEHFSKFIPKDNIVTWHTPLALNRDNEYTPEQIHNAQLLREAFFAQLNPDFVLITSLFEGFHDGAVTGIFPLPHQTPTAIVLYDLIPMIYPEIYLGNSYARAHYYEKVRSLQQADLLLSISESARDEAQTHLERCPPIEVISSAAEVHFKKINYSIEEKTERLHRLKLKKEFLMYTGGLDPRKNIERLIEAFSKLPRHLIDSHQLAIVCAIKPNEKQHLLKQIKHHGLTEEEVVITGYIEEDQLVALYNCCKGFIFPSIHEGFGLPILEAMQCGAPVIGSNRSSLPEAIGYSEALFDPENISEITKKIEQLLTDEAYRNQLIQHAKHQVTLFSWTDTARKTLHALESNHRESSPPLRVHNPKLKLAFCSPFPPEKTGIAEYSQQLLPVLSKYYEIELIVAQPKVNASIANNYRVRSIEWFMRNANQYQRVLYHFGNSTFHTHQFESIRKIPGVVVLHDFYLSGILAHIEMTTREKIWSKALYESHGYDALFARYHSQNLNFTKQLYPCNQPVIQSAVGIIVHTEESLRLAKKWLNEPHDKPWFKIPHLKSLNRLTQKEARQHLHLPEDIFITASFGFLAPSRQSLETLKAWSRSSLCTQPNHYLIFVGANEGLYAQSIRSYIAENQLENRVIITGWIEQSLFQYYLKAVDIAVQLRKESRGETSGAVLDCLGSGLPTIVNAHGSMRDLDENIVLKIPDTYTLSELTSCLEKLASDKHLQSQLSNQATKYINTYHQATHCARAYFDAIEKSYSTLQPFTILQHMQPVDDEKTLLFLESLVINQPPRAIKHLLVDVTHWKTRSSKYTHILKQLIHHPPEGYRVEPIYQHRNEPFFRYARRFMLTQLKIRKKSFELEDTIISTHREDVYLSFSVRKKQWPLLHVLDRRGVHLILPMTEQTLTTRHEKLQKILEKYTPFYTWDITDQVYE